MRESTVYDPISKKNVKIKSIKVKTGGGWVKRDTDGKIIDASDDNKHRIGLFESEELNEIMSRIERIKTDISHHSNRTKRSVKVVLKKRSTAVQLHRKARSLAIKTLKLNLAKKPLKQLTRVERSRIEYVVATKTKLINRIAMRLLPRIKKIEQTRMTHSNYTKE